MRPILAGYDAPAPFHGGFAMKTFTPILLESAIMLSACDSAEEQTADRREDRIEQAAEESARAADGTPVALDLTERQLLVADLLVSDEPNSAISKRRPRMPVEMPPNCSSRSRTAIPLLRDNSGRRSRTCQARQRYRSFDVDGLVRYRWAARHAFAVSFDA